MKVWLRKLRKILGKTKVRKILVENQENFSCLTCDNPAHNVCFVNKIYIYLMEQVKYKKNLQKGSHLKEGTLLQESKIKYIKTKKNLITVWGLGVIDIVKIKYVEIKVIERKEIKKKVVFCRCANLTPIEI